MLYELHENLPPKEENFLFFRARNHCRHHFFSCGISHTRKMLLYFTKNSKILHRDHVKPYNKYIPHSTPTRSSLAHSLHPLHVHQLLSQ